MNKDQQSIAYPILLAVRDGRVDAKNAAVQLHRTIDINQTSAEILIYVHQHMTRGEEYKRALSAVDSEFLLDRIGSNEGAEGLKLALQAFELHIRYREAQNVVQTGNRRILQEHQGRLHVMRLDDSKDIVDLQTLNQEFSEAVQRSARDSVAARRKRLRRASKRPSIFIRTVQILQRNPDVVAEVLFQADGICGGCRQPAPFKRRSDGTPYLEVHHKTPLSCGGDDTVENAVALCPNCHRLQHFGPVD